MPVAASVPCRLRLDARTVSDRPADVEAALAAALGRALDRSRREVLEPRGSYLAAVTHDPTFRWSGAALDHVPRATRRAFEERLRGVVQDAVAAARLDPTLDPETPPPLPPNPAEPLDRRRWRRLLGAYHLPAYDDSGNATVLSFDDEPLDVEAAPAASYEWVLKPVAEVRDHITALVREAVGQYGPLPPGAPAGLIAHVLDKRGRPTWLVLVGTTPPSILAFDRFGEMLYKHGRFEPETRDPVPGRGTIERRLVHDRAGLIAVTEEVMGEDIRIRIEQAEPINTDVQTTEEYNLLVDRKIDEEVKRRVDQQLKKLKGKPPTSVVIVRMGGAFVLAVGTAQDDESLHWTGPANLLPVTVEKPVGGEEGGGRPGRGGGGREGAKAGGGAEGAAPGTGGEGGGTGTGVGMGAGEGGKPPPGGFVFDPTLPGEPAEGETSRFPLVPHLFPAEVEACVALNGEPPLSALGKDGEPLRRMIDDIAFRLQIKPCYFAARFCLQAAHAIHARAHDISTYITTTERAAFTQPVPEGNGDLGPITFQAVASPAVQFLRHLAGVVSRLHNLALQTMRTYESPEHWPKVQGGWMDSPASWNLHFLEDFTPDTEAAVGEIFLTGCQALLLQLLLSSKQGIDARLANFPRYAPIFERLMVSQLSDYAELQGLRDALKRHAAAKLMGGLSGTGTAPATGADTAAAWFTAARSLTGAFTSGGQALTSTGGAGEIVETGGVARIRDSHGVMWSETDIEQALVTQRGSAEGIDPLVKQMTNIPDVLSRFKTDRDAIRDVLHKLLLEMQENNGEMLRKAKADAWWAFSASRISDDIPSATVPGSRYALQGIHLQVHQAIGAFFGGDTFYALGIDALFNAELGRQELTSFGINLSIVLLSVLCPPLGFLAGVGVALGAVARARERARLFGALIDPELVLTRAEVEIELFAAYLGLALSLLPEVGTVGGAVARGGKAALAGGLRAGLRAAGRYVLRRVARQIVEAAARDLLQAFITEILVQEVMSRVIEKVLEPVLAHIEREVMLTESVGGPEGARFALMVLGQEQAAALTSNPAGAAP
jgi:hypothetical protein